LAVLVGAWACLAPTVAPAGPASKRKTEVVLAVRKVMPSVVNISSEKKAASSSRWPFSPEESQRPRVSGMGTGVIIDARGYVLTNQHVVDKVQGIEVRLHDGSTLAGQVVQQDAAMDLAILKVEAGRPLAPITIGTSSDLMLGEEVITIGNAFGYENTVSRGIISQIGRNVTLSDDQVYRNLIQTDACINPGNSGGPLINIDGELIGICVAVRAGAQGIGFALPIDDVKRVAADLLSTRRLAGMWHGLVTGDVVGEQGRSLIVRDVAVGSPAEVAGIRPGDQLVKVGDLGVENALDVERALLDARPGRKSPVLIRRAGQEQALALEVQRMPRGNPAGPDAGEQIWRSLGLKTVAVTPDYVTRVNPNLRGGLYIQAISPGSPADLAMLQKGDILVGMNVGDRHWETIRPDNILYILRQSEAAGAPTIQYYIVRRNTIQQGALSLAEVASSASRR
jgi:serine protease Do